MKHAPRPLALAVCWAALLAGSVAAGPTAAPSRPEVEAWLARAVESAPGDGPHFNAYVAEIQGRIAAMYVRLGRTDEGAAHLDRVFPPLTDTERADAAARVQRREFLTWRDRSASSRREALGREVDVCAIEGDAAHTIALLRTLPPPGAGGSDGRHADWEQAAALMTACGWVDAADALADAMPADLTDGPLPARPNLLKTLARDRAVQDTRPSELAGRLIVEGELDKAAALLARVDDRRHRAGVEASLALAHARRGERAPAAAFAKRAEKDGEEKFYDQDRIPDDLVATLGETYARTGRRADAKRMLDLIAAKHRGRILDDRLAPTTYARVIRIHLLCGDVAGALRAVDHPPVRLPTEPRDRYGAVAYEFARAGRAGRLERWVESLRGPEVSPVVYPTACVAMAEGLLERPADAAPAAEVPLEVARGPAATPPATSPSPRPTSAPATRPADVATRGRRLRVEPLLAVGNPAPGVEKRRITSLVVGPAMLGEGGAAAVIAALTPDPDGRPRRGLWAGAPGDLRLVALTGAAAPDWPDAGSTLSSIETLTGIDAAGRVLFSGEVRGDGVTPGQGGGLWYGAPGGVKLVGRAGGPLAGGAVAAQNVTGIDLTPGGTLLVRANFETGPVYYLGAGRARAGASGREAAG